jgi:hypothetical protein
MASINATRVFLTFVAEALSVIFLLLVLGVSHAMLTDPELTLEPVPVFDREDVPFFSEFVGFGADVLKQYDATGSWAAMWKDMMFSDEDF